MTAALEETRSRRTRRCRRNQRQAKRKRVVIIGGGFAGIAAARALRHADAEVVLIDRRNHHIFQPLLYQVATAVLAPAEIAAPIRQLEAKQQEPQRAAGGGHRRRLCFPHGRRRPAPASGVRKIAFDYLVVATGMRPSYFGHDEFARYAPGLKSLERRRDDPSQDPERLRTGRNDRRRGRTRATDDVRAGRRRSHWRGAGGVHGANGDGHAARAISAASIRRRARIILLEGGQADSADFCRVVVPEGGHDGSRSLASRS